MKAMPGLRIGFHTQRLGTANVRIAWFMATVSDPGVENETHDCRLDDAEIENEVLRPFMTAK